MQVFLNYSWDSEPHKAWVLELANRLTSDGVELCFDRYDLKPGSNINHFMEKIEACEKVIFIMSSGYKSKADNRSGGLGYEYQIITSELASDLIETKKFIPVLRDGDVKSSIPTLLRSFLYHDMREDKIFEQKYLELLHLIYDEPLIKKPKLGSKPLLGTENSLRQELADQSGLKSVKKVHDIVANSVYRLMAEIEGEGNLDRDSMLDKLENIYVKSRDMAYDRTEFTEPPFHQTVSKLLSSSASEHLRIVLLGNTASIWEGIDKHRQYQVRTIMQEITDNMKNHSQATLVSWEFERSGDQVAIFYSDNGVGMKNNRQEMSKSSRENGLRIIGTLLDTLGGEIAFENALSKGLNIKITFPAKDKPIGIDHETPKSMIPLKIHDFTPYDITLIKLLAQGVPQKEIPQILQSKNMQPSGLSSIEKRLNIIKLAYDLSGNAQLVALCKDMGII